MLQNYRIYLLETFGIERDRTATMNSDIQLQYEDECEPFGEIITDLRGKATLRVGKVSSKTPIVKIRH